MQEFFLNFFHSIPVLGDLPNRYFLIWPMAETAHFLGLTLLVGAIGVLDLRMLGVGKAMSSASVHRLVPIGIFGFFLNMAGGLIFVTAKPETYIPNGMFQLKMLFILLAGLNVFYFYFVMFRRVEAVPAGGDTPLGAKMVAGISMSLWIGVIITGRFMAWF